jgi:hypothetical protein
MDQRFRRGLLPLGFQRPPPVGNNANPAESEVKSNRHGLAQDSVPYVRSADVAN